MVQLWQRLKRVTTASAHARVDALECPAQMMDQVVREQVGAVAGAKTAQRRAKAFRLQIEARMAQEHDTAARMLTLAQQALAAGREDQARTAVRRKQEAGRRLDELTTQLGRAQRAEARTGALLDGLLGELDRLREKRRLIVQRTWLHHGLAGLDGLSGVAESHEEVVARMEEKTLMRDAALDAQWDVDACPDDLEGFARNHDIDQELAALKAAATI